MVMDKQKNLTDYCFVETSEVPKGRENLGDWMPVDIYRLFQYTLRDTLEKEEGHEGMVRIFRNAGRKAGKRLTDAFLNPCQSPDHFLAQLQKIMQEKKIGVLRVEEFDPDSGRAVMTISEDLDCYGLPMLSETVCNYDEGLIAGILEQYTGKSYQVTETDCWATGARACRFVALPQ